MRAIIVTGNGTKTKNDEEKSIALNNFFSSVFTTENESFTPDLDNKISEDKYIHTISTTEEEMKEQLKNLKPNKSPGTDEIHPHLLRECASNLAKPLSILFNLTVKQSKLPAEFKTSRD